jgi:hypothetical protein
MPSLLWSKTHKTTHCPDFFQEPSLSPTVLLDSVRQFNAFASKQERARERKTMEGQNGFTSQPKYKPIHHRLNIFLKKNLFKRKKNVRKTIVHGPKILYMSYLLCQHEKSHEIQSERRIYLEFFFVHQATRPFLQCPYGHEFKQFDGKIIFRFSANFSSR